MGSFNEVSGRYTKMDTEYYTPKTFRVPVEGKEANGVSGMKIPMTLLILLPAKP